MFSKYLTVAATALSLSLSSQAMAAGEQLQLIQDAEQLKTALAGEPVVLTPQIVSVTITSGADKMFPSGLAASDQRRPARQDGANAL
jgi:hypothetical protein